MTREHPITPPPELMQQWANAWHTGTCTQELLEYIATQAARWGANQELEASIKLLSELGGDGEMIRRHRRPKPPSLKEQALGALEHLALGPDPTAFLADMATIRRALEALPDD